MNQQDKTNLSPNEAEANNLTKGHDQSARRPVLAEINPDDFIKNTTRAGITLHEAANDMVDLLELAGRDISWLDDGARMFAEALIDWSDGEIQMAAVTLDGKTPTHVAGYLPPQEGVDLPGFLIDGAGLEWADDLQDKLQFLVYPSEGKLATGDDAWDLVSGLQFDPEISQTAARTLNLVVGRFDDWKAGLHRQVPAPIAHRTAEWEAGVPLLTSSDKPELSLYGPMNGEITQLSRAGRELQKAAHEAKDRLGDHGVTLTQGRIFTDALATWSDGRITPVTVTHNMRTPTYMVGKLVLGSEDRAIAMLMDDEGPTGTDVLDGRLTMHGHKPEASLVFGKKAKDMAQVCPPRHEASRMVAEILTEKVGSFAQWESNALGEFELAAPRTGQPEMPAATSGPSPGM